LITSSTTNIGIGTCRLCLADGSNSNAVCFDVRRTIGPSKDFAKTINDCLLDSSLRTGPTATILHNLQSHSHLVRKRRSIIRCSTSSLNPWLALALIERILTCWYVYRRPEETNLFRRRTAAVSIPVPSKPSTFLHVESLLPPHARHELSLTSPCVSASECSGPVAVETTALGARVFGDAHAPLPAVPGFVGWCSEENVIALNFKISFLPSCC